MIEARKVLLRGDTRSVTQILYDAYTARRDTVTYHPSFHSTLVNICDILNIYLEDISTHSSPWDWVWKRGKKGGTPLVSLLRDNVVISKTRVRDSGGHWCLHDQDIYKIFKGAALKRSRRRKTLPVKDQNGVMIEGKRVV